jgi:hypothetical protein
MTASEHACCQKMKGKCGGMRMALLIAFPPPMSDPRQSTWAYSTGYIWALFDFALQA